ncbi:MAG: hypothetical protein LC098_11520 [Burkholderiales bacterium]|nr:hypothetical protein [Burkholderiales bacterium]
MREVTPFAKTANLERQVTSATRVGGLQAAIERTADTVTSAMQRPSIPLRCIEATGHFQAIQLDAGRRIHNGLEARNMAKVDLQTGRIPLKALKRTFHLLINELDECHIAQRANR